MSVPVTESLRTVAGSIFWMSRLLRSSSLNATPSDLRDTFAVRASGETPTSTPSSSASALLSARTADRSDSTAAASASAETGESMRHEPSSCFARRHETPPSEIESPATCAGSNGKSLVSAKAALPSEACSLSERSTVTIAVPLWTSA